MKKSIGISGTGRIGRLLIRIVLSQYAKTNVLKAINSVYPAETVAHLLKYDSVHGRWDVDIFVVNQSLHINGLIIPVVNYRDPKMIPWRELGVDLVIDATGKFTDREGAKRHLDAGAHSVIVTAPGEQLDHTIVMGVNESSYDPINHHLLSSASCTTNCLAPILKIMDEAFHIKQGWMTTIHASTSDQNHLDNPHKDLRRARACTQSIIPTSTGVGKALEDVLPNLASLITGTSIRVPTQDVSLVDLTLQVKKPVNRDLVEWAIQEAVSGNLKLIVSAVEEPLVSVDFIGCEKSAVIDLPSIMVMDDHIKLLAWYDNEWAYSCRVVELSNYVCERIITDTRLKNYS